MQIDVDAPEHGVLSHIRSGWSGRRGVAMAALTVGSVAVTASMLLKQQGAVRGAGGWFIGIIVAGLVVALVSLFVVHRERRAERASWLRSTADWQRGTACSSPVPGLRGAVELRADAVGVHVLRTSTAGWDVFVICAVFSVPWVYATLNRRSTHPPVHLPIIIALGACPALGLPRRTWTRVIAGWDEIRSVDIDGPKFTVRTEEGELVLDVRYSARTAFTEDLRRHGGEKVRIAGTPVPKRPSPPTPRITPDEAAARLDALRRDGPGKGG
ncbi:MAG: hypothetical protein HMLKMBBP_03529 [Planctomycetes bacterium]|nr:hypothetical protein [Planctomycetota bacterium]